MAPTNLALETGIVVMLMASLACDSKFLSPHQQPLSNGSVEDDSLHARHPSCSVSVSRSVRKRIHEEVLRPSSEAGLASSHQWPDGCPFDPSADVFAQKEKNKTRSPGICLADYCDVFEVCEDDTRNQKTSGELDQCDSNLMEQARRRCNLAMSRCFPLHTNHKVTRMLHAHYSRQWCQVLDCDIRAEKHRQHIGGLQSLPRVLGVVVILSGTIFAAMIFLFQGGDELLQLLLELGIIPSSFFREGLRARNAFRISAGLSRTKGC
eukprot:TRINITY_DN86259_c0_g1_i1.p1 TRINITY_DN86259_c0_g1~~TRINITY_DN86259_c0_g1_i1.p1  ORF type:complete len:279 (+),score=44.85 TRINITY_DN86259_c0_g1_i1:45-839(+)